MNKFQTYKKKTVIVSHIDRDFDAPLEVELIERSIQSRYKDDVDSEFSQVTRDTDIELRLLNVIFQ